jgi:hypothetical protein
LALDRNRLRLGIRQLDFTTATDCCVGSGSLGAQIRRLGVGRGPLAVKIELVGEQRIALLAIHGRKGLTHRWALSVHFSRLHETVAFPGRVPLRRSNIIAESPDYVIRDWPNRESLA